MTAPPSAKLGRARNAAAGVTLVAALIAWLSWPSREPPGRDLAAKSRVETTATSSAIAAPPPHAAWTSEPVARVAARAATDDDNVVGAGPNDPHEPGMHPHPITPEHRRIDAENHLIQKLNDAMALRDVNALRELLVEYRKLDPGDIEATQAGYEIIADCIEFPGEASLAEARNFYDKQRHSPLRRFVRRICFENTN